MKMLYLLVPLAPLVGAIVAGLFGRAVGRAGAHWVTISGVAVAMVASCFVLADVLAGNTFNGPVYTWAQVAGLKLEVGFLIDTLSATMMVVVTSVSLAVHVYTIGYMQDDPGYQRFFSYISLFTFSMLMLVMSNNFLQLFFGWEAVGLVSYLLIGFWYTRPTAIVANLKAFLVNRVGDFGFILGIGLLLSATGTLDYAATFVAAPDLAAKTISLFPGSDWPLLAVACICLFIGAMGKSAQFPLHVWLPDSMEGPTPISALIHAATMVTAGIFMVARMSPLFELSDIALSFVLIIGSITALFMGFLGIVQNDIKRVVAYSTLSQLGYMTVALGASAYSVAFFHLMTHAFFKALLFLAAGSVIIGMHHDQDIRNMGGLWKKMPVTWAVSLLGSLALIGAPFFSGFYSKDMIIEAVRASNLAAAPVVYLMLLLGVFVTAFYSFRMFFLVFHGRPRWSESGGHHGQDGHGDHGHGGSPHESPLVVTLPLVALAIPSVILGGIAIGPMLFGDYFKGVITVDSSHPAMAVLASHYHGAIDLALHSIQTLPFWLALAGVLVSGYFYLMRPSIPEAIAMRFSAIHRLLDQKYFMDRFNEIVFAGGARLLGGQLWKRADQGLIDGFVVNGSTRVVAAVASIMRIGQTGYLYHYAIAMILGVALMLWWFAPVMNPVPMVK
ncbi:MAG: NADH-quinone oxidoreductase subunit L [Burkholderiaceae bacterium]|jgi:NADH-quinone oxidoreductase subunit L|nr:NADH-quinone oxidoreductase subunit L [Burkholderiaceae bacterium]